MDKSRISPVAGGSGDHEVICIEAKRLCDFCFQEHHIERTFETTVPGNGQQADCEIDERGTRCRVVSRREVDHGKKDRKELICLAIEVPVTIRIFNQAGTVVQTIEETVVFLKQAVLCVPSGTDVECRVTGDCCCFFDPLKNVLSCIFDFCVVIQTQIIVRVLVPTLGQCQPKRCVSTVLGCPPHVSKDCKECDC